MKAALLAMVALALLAACGESPDPVPPRPTPTPESGASAVVGSRTVIDMAGRTISVHEDIRTVAALSPAAIDFAIALGLEVVARPADVPAAAAPNSKPAGTTISPDFNAVAASQPDLVLADAAYHSGRTQDFDRFAYPVFVLKVNSYAEVLTAITTLGDVVGEVEEAAAVRKATEERARNAIESARSKPGTAPRVLILTGGGRDVFAGSPATYLGSLVEQLRGVNVVTAATVGGPIPGFGVIDPGQAALLNPDVVLILSSGQGGLALQLRSDPAWANTAAVRKSRVVDLDTTLFLRAPGPRVGEALEKLLLVLWL